MTISAGSPFRQRCSIAALPTVDVLSGLARSRAPDRIGRLNLAPGPGV